MLMLPMIEKHADLKNKTFEILFLDLIKETFKSYIHVYTHIHLRGSYAYVKINCRKNINPNKFTCQ